MENHLAHYGIDRLSHHFNITVDNVGYRVVAMPFSFNNQMRYKVNVNNGASGILAWDDELGIYQELNGKATILPNGVLRAINFKLMDLALQEEK